MPNYIFDWDSVFATGSSPTQTLYGPVDLTFSTTPAVGGAPASSFSSLVNTTSTLGATNGYLRLSMNAGTAGEGIVQTINFNNTALPGAGVTNVNFQLLDVDQSSWDDQVEVIAYDVNGVALPLTAYTLTTTGPATIVNNTVNGQTNVNDATTAGNIDVSIAGEVSRVDIVYTAGPDFPGNPFIQVIGVGPITYDAVGIFDDRDQENPVPTDQADDGIIAGTAGNDVIFGGLTTDGGLTAGGTSGADADTTNPNDVIDGGAGADSIYSGAGDDTITLSDGFGGDSIVGGETTETGGDTLDGSGLSAPVTVNLTGDEAGTFTDGTSTATFSEIETFNLSNQNDVFDGSGTNSPVTVNAGDGVDSITGTSGDDLINTGSGADRVLLNDGFGNDNAADFSQVGGDRVDVSAMSDPGTSGYNPTGVDTRDFDLSDATDNGDGTTTIVFPGGETLTLPTVNIDQTDVNTLRTSLFNIGIPCFTRGVMIATPDGEKAVEDLEVGDLVLTRDRGAQPIRWIGHREMPALGNFAPIVIKAGAMGNDRDLKVSPQHRMLVTGWQAEVMFGEPEVLAAAKHLVNGDTIYAAEGGQVEYFHVLFDEHEIVTSNGAESESFHPGSVTMSSMEDETREEVFAIFPELRDDLDRGYGASARMSLKKYEVEAMLALSR